MQARSRREYDDAVTREGDHNKRKKKPHKYPSMLHVVHKKYTQATTTPPAAEKQVCYMPYVCMHNAVTSAIQGSYVSSNAKVRRHEKRNENRTGEENQQEVAPKECLCSPPLT